MGVIDAFDEIAAAAWQESKTPLERIYDALWPGWDDGEMPAEMATVRLLDKAGQPFCCSACGHSDLWAMTRYGKWRCSGEHEPVMCGNGYIEQIIEVKWDEVMVSEQH